MDEILTFFLTRKGGTVVLIVCLLVGVSALMAGNLSIAILSAIAAYILWRLMENEAPDPDDDLL